MIKVKTSWRDDKTKWLEFRRRVKSLNGAGVTVGVHPDAGNYPGKDGPPVAAVAAWNEYGTKTIPERSFIRSTMDENESKMGAWLARAAEEVLHGKASVHSALDKVGDRLAELMRKKAASGVPPENALSTLEQKRREGVGSTPLLWTRKMLRSIAHKVSR